MPTGHCVGCTCGHPQEGPFAACVALSARGRAPVPCSLCHVRAVIMTSRELCKGEWGGALAPSKESVCPQGEAVSPTPRMAGQSPEAWQARWGPPG